MAFVECATQADVDKVKAGDIAVVRKGHFTAYDSSTVRAYDSSTVRAYGSSTVTAYDSSTVRAYGSSTVTAYDSSTVTAYDSSTVRAYGSSTVTASPYSAVHKLSSRARIKGGVVIEPPALDTPERWCDFYGVKVTRGRAVLFKAVEDDWRGQHKKPGLTYKPGAKPKAPDWSPVASCGGGLHLSPRPFMARVYCDTASHLVACSVALKDIVIIGDKVKVPSCNALYEVDEDGRKIEATT